MMSLGYLHVPGPDHPRLRLQDKALREALLAIPVGGHNGWSRYDTDNEHVLIVWDGEQTFEVRVGIEAAAISQQDTDRAAR